MGVAEQQPQLEDAVNLRESRNHDQQHGPETLVAFQQRVGEQEHVAHGDVVLERQLRAGQNQEREEERFALLLAGELSGQGEDRRKPQREVEDIPHESGPQPCGQVGERCEEDVEQGPVEKVVQMGCGLRPVFAVGSDVLPEELRGFGEDHEVPVASAGDLREGEGQDEQHPEDIEVPRVEEKFRDAIPEGSASPSRFVWIVVFVMAGGGGYRRLRIVRNGSPRTPKKASRKMPPDIFETPSQRSTKMIETSWSLSPSFQAVYFISIWNP